jgi:hypothetical protein
VLTPHLVEFEAITDLVDQLCSVLPPKLPLTSKERAALTHAGARVLYVHGGSLDPGWSLALCLAAIAGSRYALVKAGVADVGPKVREATAAA